MKKSFSSKHEDLSKYSNLILSYIFSKSQLFSLFLTCNLIGVSCGHFFLLMQRTRLREPYRYFEHVHKVNQKNSRNFWKKKVSAQNMRFCQNIRTWFWASFFQNLNFFRFSLLIGSVCRKFTIFLLTQRNRLDGHFRYLAHVHKVSRKFSRGLWKKIWAQNIGFVRKFEPDFELHFSKSQLFSHLLTCNLIGVPCGHECVYSQERWFLASWLYTDNSFLK